MDRVALLSARIGEHQRVAAEQWEIHTGHLGGLLSGVADLTDDGRPPHTSLCLRRLADKMRMDKHLAAPLDSVAGDLDRWRQLIDTMRAVIDDGASLHAAYRIKRLLRIGVAVAVALAITAVGVWALRVHAARGRVDAHLSATDPCEANAVDDSDLAKASDEQRGAIDEQRRACEARAAAERQREAERVEQERVEAEQARLEAERNEACVALANALEAGPLEAGPPGDSALLRGRRELIDRMARGALAPGDITADHGDFLCSDTPAGARVAGLFARAALARAGEWMYDHRMSPSTAKLVVAGRAALGEKAKSIFAASVDRMATGAVNMGDEEQIAHVLVLCQLVVDLGEPARQMCRAAGEASR
jgi:hypothetical protein